MIKLYSPDIGFLCQVGEWGKGTQVVSTSSECVQYILMRANVGKSSLSDNSDETTRAPRLHLDLVNLHQMPSMLLSSSSTNRGK